MLPVFVIMGLAYKLIKKTSIIRSSDVDLETFKDVIDAEEEKFAADAAEKEALREAQGNPHDKEWYYNKFIGWLF